MYNLTTQAIKLKAQSLGFDFCRIIKVQQAPHISFYKSWLQKGYAGSMNYLKKNVAKKENPALLNEDTTTTYQSIIVLAVNYHQCNISDDLLHDPSRGIIASYALTADYHEIIKPLLFELDDYISTLANRNSKAKCFVDTGPVLERDWAALSGIGFFGKNCCIINPNVGSWIFLATLVIPEMLEYDTTQTLPIATANPFDFESEKQWHFNFGKTHFTYENKDYEKNPLPKTQGGCGTCAACLYACPTNALQAPYVLNAQKCISYWTIESKDIIPKHLRSQFGNRIFGCDICQEQCPWNKNITNNTRISTLFQLNKNLIAPPLLEGFNDNNPYWLNDEAFLLQFKNTPIKRAKRIGMLRNVCTALGNWGSVTTIHALSLALQDNAAVVRAHAVWGLQEVYKKTNDSKALILLQAHQLIETDALVCNE